MKTNQLTPLILVSFLAACNAAPKTKFSVQVYDAETQAPISNALVKVSFSIDKKDWNEPRQTTKEEKRTNSDALCFFEGETHYRPGIGVYVDGYYVSRPHLDYEKINRSKNRWKPWNPTVEVKLRKKKNPVQMAYKRVKRNQIPSFEKAVGFDLEKAAWVSPYGKGKVSDLIFKIEKETEPKEGIRYSLSFSNPLDGLQEYVPPKSLESEFIFPYLAPTNNYIATLNKYRLLKYPVLSDYPANNLKDDSDINYLFRVRTKTEKDKSIISTCYGRIKGEVKISSKGNVSFEYWFNPIPNERSLEYSGENLLPEKKGRGRRR